ncbi:MAG: hypothetical protein Tsb0017_21710 [Geothermobacteraceae bacterium]
MADKSPHRAVVPQEDLAGCTCGKEHPQPVTTLCLDSDAIEILAGDCRGRGKVLLISDPDTEQVAGRDLCHALESKDVSFDRLCLGSQPEATEDQVDEVAAAAKDADLIVGIGAGTISDLAKFAGDRLKLPSWCLATAPSMNGYTSAIAAIKVRGVKRTLPCKTHDCIYAVPEIVCRAPLKLKQAGFCDVMAKVVSDVDWQCESLLFSNSYCALPSAMLARVEKEYAKVPEAIGRGEDGATMALFQGLLTSGVAMSLAGSSAPASGGEHLVSHFWDMREAVTGRRPELHGLQVGLGIVLSAACYRRLARLSKKDLKPIADGLLGRLSESIPSIWGCYAEEVAAQLRGKESALRQFDQLLPETWDQLVPLFRQVRPPEEFADLFQRTGAPFTLEAFDLSAEEFLLAALNARAIRERITVLDLADHAGELEAAAEESLRLLRRASPSRIS